MSFLVPPVHADDATCSGAHLLHRYSMFRFALGIVGQKLTAGFVACIQPFSDVYPHLRTATDVPTLVKIADVNWDEVDAAFCCLPHATTQETLAQLPKHIKIVDLSADFRLRNVDTYAEWCVTYMLQAYRRIIEPCQTKVQQLLGVLLHSADMTQHCMCHMCTNTRQSLAQDGALQHTARICNKLCSA